MSLFSNSSLSSTYAKLQFHLQPGLGPCLNCPSSTSPPPCSRTPSSHALYSPHSPQPFLLPASGQCSHTSSVQPAEHPLLGCPDSCGSSSFYLPPSQGYALEFASPHPLPPPRTAPPKLSLRMLLSIHGSKLRLLSLCHSQNLLPT